MGPALAFGKAAQPKHKHDNDGQDGHNQYEENRSGRHGETPLVATVFIDVAASVAKAKSFCIKCATTPNPKRRLEGRDAAPP
jgi:hypothetical protein